jgi:hypothetical protein
MSSQQIAHDIFWAKVKRLQKAFYETHGEKEIKPDSIQPKNGVGLTVTTFNSVFWVGKNLRDPDARQLKELSEVEFDELIERVENGEYESVWMRSANKN